MRREKAKRTTEVLACMIVLPIKAREVAEYGAGIPFNIVYYTVGLL